jgi:predicted nucleic acid-binding protein
MKVALDTNVLAYAEGVNGMQAKKAALEIIGALPQGAVVVPVQTLGELFRVLVSKAGWKSQQARVAVLSWADAYQTMETSADVMLAAADAVVAHKLGIWDAVILCASEEAGCRLLLSEDMQDGFTYKGITIANPFAETQNPLLQALLNPGKP